MWGALMSARVALSVSLILDILDGPLRGCEGLCCELPVAEKGGLDHALVGNPCVKCFEGTRSPVHVMLLVGGRKLLMISNRFLSIALPLLYRFVPSWRR
jgi:hypothetical protein